MYAYRRANVAELNRQGREVWRSLGRLGETELVAPGGARYAVGDRVVTLAPAAGGKVVTSETGTVVALGTEANSLSIRMDDDNEIRRLARVASIVHERSLGIRSWSVARNVDAGRVRSVMRARWWASAYVVTALNTAPPAPRV